MDTNVTPALGSLASSIDWRAIENLIILNLILFRSWGSFNLFKSWRIIKYGILLMESGPPACERSGKAANRRKHLFLSQLCHTMLRGWGTTFCNQIPVSPTQQPNTFIKVWTIKKSKTHLYVYLHIYMYM